MWLETMIVLVELAQPLEQVADLDAGPGVETARRFVEQQHLRLVQERSGQTDALRLPAGQLVDHRVALERHVDQLEFFLANFASRRAIDAVRGCEELQVFHHRHVVVDAEEVGHVADEAADFLRVGIDRLAADIGLAVVGVEQRGDHPHRRGFARSVGTDEPEDIAIVELEVDFVGGDQVAVALGQLAGLDHVWSSVSGMNRR